MWERLRHACVVLFSFVMLLVLQIVPGCVKGADPEVAREAGSTDDALRVDPATGIPFAPVFQIPIRGFTTSDFGFGFGAENRNFCMESANGVCLSYGAHLGRDTLVPKTPVGTEVLAPADGIVRVTTDRLFGGYGSDSALNPNYDGCLIVLEHEFASGQAVTTLLGHVKCEDVSSYDPVAMTGNPADGTIVRRGQYVAHIRPYYHGATTGIIWSHLHWGMRQGRFDSAFISRYIQGYAKRSEFSKDPATGALQHPTWIDPFVVVASNGDPASLAASGVMSHPSGSLLEDSQGNAWLVTGNALLAAVPRDTFQADRFDAQLAVRVSDEEIGCYSKAPNVTPLGRVTMYQRPGTSTVVMALDDRKERYDFVRWEALLSWGFSASDIVADVAVASARETAYANRGLRLLRPGTLVKGDASSEVAIVTWRQTRLPIASADVFEALGFTWESVMTVPQEVLDAVAGPRESLVVSWDTIHQCAVPPPCPDGGTCGGGGPGNPDAGPVDSGVTDSSLSDAEVVDTGMPDVGAPDTGTKPVETCNGLDDNGNGQVDEIFQCKLGDIYGPTCVTSCGTAGQRVCEAPACSWGTCRGMAENCSNTLDDDCNGLTDCLDPACTNAPECVPKPDAGMDTSSTDVLVTFSYAGPSAPGLIWIEGWWQPPASAVRTWGRIAECADTISGDGKLDCAFMMPRWTSPFEFQVYLPDGRFWGDESNDPLGGHGATIGTVSMRTAAGPLAYSMVPNNKSGQPYFNGHVASVP